MPTNFKTLEDVRQWILDNDMTLQEARGCVELAIESSKAIQREILALGVEAFISRLAYLWRRQPPVSPVPMTHGQMPEPEPQRGKPKISNHPPKERGWMDAYQIYGADGLRVPMARATKDDLRTAIRHARGSIAGYQRNIDLYSAILAVMHKAKKATDKTPVGDILTERAFRRMATEAGVAQEIANVA